MDVLNPSVVYLHVVLQLRIDENSSRMTLSRPHEFDSAVETALESNFVRAVNQTIFRVVESSADNVLMKSLEVVHQLYPNGSLRRVLEVEPTNAREQSSASK